MKRISILFAFIAMMSFAGAADGQQIGFGVSQYSSTQELVQSSFPVTDINRPLKIYQIVRTTTSDEACFNTTDFSGARLVGPSVASLGIDLSTNSYNLKWIVDLATQDSCRILFVATGDGDVDGRDFLIWQRGNSPAPAATAGSVEKGEVPEATSLAPKKNPYGFRLVYTRSS